MEKKDIKSIKTNRPKHLQVNLGDHVLEKETNRLGCIHKIGLLGSKKNFIVKWLNDGEMTAYTSAKTQQNLIKTGHNIYDSDSD